MLKKISYTLMLMVLLLSLNNCAKDVVYVDRFVESEHPNIPMPKKTNTDLIDYNDFNVTIYPHSDKNMIVLPFYEIQKMKDKADEKWYVTMKLKNERDILRSVIIDYRINYVTKIK